MPELKRRRRAASEPDADSADATQEYSPYVPTFQSARPEDPNAQPTFTNETRGSRTTRMMMRIFPPQLLKRFSRTKPSKIRIYT